MKTSALRIINFICVLCVLVGCGKATNKEFVIISGSENSSLEPLLEPFEKKQKIDIVMKYKGSIDIEGWHDPVYRRELEMTGQVHALHYLKRCRGGDYVENPV